MERGQLELKVKYYNSIRDNEDLSKLIRFLASLYSKHYTRKWERWYD